MRSYVRPTDRSAFTLIEMLVVIAITAVLLSFLVPALTQSKVVARIALCAGNMRQHAVMLGMYAADSTDMIPTPNSPHRLALNTFNTGSAIAVISNGGVGDTCPMASKFPGTRVYPVNYGFFFWQGYVPPLARGGKQDRKLFECPDSPLWPSQGNKTYIQSYEVGSLFWYSNATLSLSRRDTIPYPGYTTTGNWDCQPYPRIDYTFRGWANGRVLAAKGAAAALKRVSDWRPNWAAAVDMEVYDAGWRNGMSDPHGNGLNIQFHDGSAKFGAKDIGGKKPYVYFSEQAGWATTNAVNNGNSGYAYYGDAGTANINLWEYYER